jgi:hypothetical protein
MSIQLNSAIINPTQNTNYKTLATKVLPRIKSMDTSEVDFYTDLVALYDTIDPKVAQISITAAICDIFNMVLSDEDRSDPDMVDMIISSCMTSVAKMTSLSAQTRRVLLHNILKSKFGINTQLFEVDSTADIQDNKDAKDSKEIEEDFVNQPIVDYVPYLANVTRKIQNINELVPVCNTRTALDMSIKCLIKYIATANTLVFAIKRKIRVHEKPSVALLPEAGEYMHITTDPEVDAYYTTNMVLFKKSVEQESEDPLETPPSVIPTLLKKCLDEAMLFRQDIRSLLINNERTKQTEFVVIPDNKIKVESYTHLINLITEFLRVLVFLINVDELAIKIIGYHHAKELVKNFTKYCNDHIDPEVYDATSSIEVENLLIAGIDDIVTEPHHLARYFTFQHVMEMFNGLLDHISIPMAPMPVEQKTSIVNIPDTTN